MTTMNWRLYYLCAYLSCYLALSSANDFCTSICASGTCCEKELGHMLCCPFENGLCCSGAETCCPQGSQCNLDGSCSTENNRLFFHSNPIYRTIIKPEPMSKSTTTSPFDMLLDNSATCAPSESECASLNGDRICCPLENGVCCEDHLHCCPAGYRCDAGNASCVEVGVPELVVPGKIRAYRQGSDRNCPVSSQSCSEAETCCQVSDEQQACCPFKDADCCADGQHCCPLGTRCNSKSTRCDRIGVVNPFQPSAWLNKTLTEARSPPSTVICPDRKSTCDFGSTCCEMRDHSYGCCPTENAVCCSDGVHCCPEGFTCDNDQGTCSAKPKSQPITTTKMPALSPPKAIACDPFFSCPDENTCCRVGDNSWGCCPFPKATCCEDKKHCCPEGFQCKLGLCFLLSDSFSRSNRLSEMLPATLVSHVVLPNENFQFSEQENASHACCNLTNAVCCSDGEHCCPAGRKCDLANAQCIDEVTGAVTPWLNKNPSQTVSNFTVCPDKRLRCPSTSTCCQNNDPEGHYSCCPHPEGDCCADGQHCCPKGTKCNSKSTGCDRIGFVNPFQPPAWLNKTITEVRSPPSTVICPDRKSTCDFDSTCCEMRDHSYGCCPTENAVCCSDGMRCCPEGFTCDNDQGTCSAIPMSQPIRTTKKPALSPSKSIACDPFFSCPDENTCCRVGENTWGCCPFPKAVCCYDGEHCCPSGRKCDLANAQCIDEVSGAVTSWVNKNPSQTVSNTTVCPDKRLRCPNSSTCCQNKDQKRPFSCCPHPEATCCSDGEHCCPKGYKCHAGSCMIDDRISTKSDQEEVTVCGDGVTKCTVNSKCCQIDEGDVWSCCPIIKSEP